MTGIAYILIGVFPYIIILAQSLFNIKIKIKYAIYPLVILLLWFLGIRLWNRNIEFFIIYLSLIPISIYLYGKLPKFKKWLKVTLTITFIAIHLTIWLLGFMLWIWVIGDYFQTQNYKKLSENHFLMMLPQGNFSDYNMMCILGKEIIGTHIFWQKDAINFIEGGMDDIQIKDKKTKVEIWNNKNSIVLEK